MAQHNINNIKENTDFLDFIKTEYGYDNFDEIPFWLQGEVLGKFQARENDIDNDDSVYLEENKNDQNLETVSKEDFDASRKNPEHLQELKAGKTFTHFINNEDFLKAEIKYAGIDENGKDLTRIELFDHQGESTGYLVQPFLGGQIKSGEINGQPIEIFVDDKTWNVKYGDLEKNLSLENISTLGLVPSVELACRNESLEVRDALLDIAAAQAAILDTSFCFFRGELTEEKHYSKERLESILKAHDIYMLTPEELEQNTDLKNLTAEEEENHYNLSAETIEQATQDIAEYADGKLTIDPDAHDAMQKYIETFGKEWQNGVYTYTPEAEKALAKLEATVTEQNNSKEAPKTQIITEERDVPNMLMIVTDNREAGSNHTTKELISQLESINAADNGLDADRLKRMTLAIKQSYGELSNQDVLDSFASDEFQELYEIVQKMPKSAKDERLNSTGFSAFENKINENESTFGQDRLLALYMLSGLRNDHSSVRSLNDILQNEADIKVADFIAKNVYGYDDPVNPTSNGVKEPYFTTKKAIEVVVPVVNTPENDNVIDFGQINENEGDGKVDNKVNGNGGNVNGPAGIVNKPEGNSGATIGGTTINGVVPGQVLEEEMEEIRERSADNFDNSLELNKIELEIMHKKELISDDDYNKALATFNKMDTVRNLAGLSSDEEIEKSRSMVEREEIVAAYQVIEAGHDKIKPNEIPEYRSDIVSNIFEKLNEGKEEYAILLTPELVSDAIKGYSKQAESKKTSEEERNAAKQNLKRAEQEAEHLISDLTKKEGYYFSDITNAADEYDGYIHLCEVCKERAEKEGKSTTVYDNGIKLMEQYVEPYDKLFNIPEKKDPVASAIKMNDRIKAADKILENIQFNEDNLGKEYIEALSNYKFIIDYDKNRNPIYEENAITKDEQGKLQIKEGSRLDTVLRFSANQAMMESLGDFDQKITKEMLLEGAKDKAFQTLFAFDNAEQTVKAGLREDPKKFTDKKFVEEFKKKLMDGQKMAISPIAFDLALKRQAHNVETYSNRVTSRLGSDKTQFLNAALLARVAKIDKTSPNKDNTDFIKKKALKRQLWGVGIGGGVAFLTSFTMTKLSANSAMANAVANAQAAVGALNLSQELARGGGNALIGAVAGAAISTAAYFATKKITAMVRKQKYGWKDVKKDLKDPATWAIIGAGALSGASMGFALSGCPQCATTCGVGALAVGGVSRFIKPYRDMRLHGHGKVKSAVMGIANASAVALGGWGGRALGLRGMEPTEATLTADEQKAKELHGKDADQRDGWNEETNNSGGDGFHKVDEKVIGEKRVYTPEETASARGRVSSWVEHDVLEKMHQDALNKGLSEDEFWEFANHSLLAKRGGLEPEFGTNRAYSDNTVTGTDFTTVDPLKIKHTDNHFLYDEGTMDAFHKDGVNITNEEVTIMGKFLQPKAGEIDENAVPLLRQYTRNIHLKDGALNTSPNSTPHINGHLPNNVQYDKELHELQAREAGSGKPTTFSSWHRGKIPMEDVKESIFAKFTKAIHIDPTSGFGTLVLGWKNKVKDFLRPGAKADKIVKENITPKPQPTPIVIDPTPKPAPIPRPEPQPKPAPEQDPTKLLMDEYRIVYGVTPYTEEGKNAEWKAYCARVEEERKAGAPDKSMNDFLLARRAKLDKTIEDNVSGNTAVNDSGTPIRSDYLKKRAQDDRGKAGVIMEARQNLQQSNLTTDNFRHKITLSHFTKFVSHFIKRDEVVADGSRNIALNPKLKDKYKEGDSKVAIVDLNQYLVDGKPLEECKDHVSGKDARQAMQTLRKNYERE